MSIVVVEHVEWTGDAVQDAVVLVEPPTFWSRVSDQLEAQLPILVFMWWIGCLFFSLRLAGGWLYVQRLRRYDTRPLSDEWQQMLDILRARLGLSYPVQLRESSSVTVPMALGYLKPLILLPIGTVNALSVAEVEAILGHELAHISRYDYLANIFQSIIEVLFYFNPAVWWLSATIRTEREHCCDDLAVQLCGSPLTYAKALVNLQEMVAQSPPALSMTLARDKNQLLNRVKRILQPQPHKFQTMEKFILTCLLLLATLLGSVYAETAATETPNAQEALENDPFLKGEEDDAVLDIPPHLANDGLGGTVRDTRDTFPDATQRIKVKEKDGDDIEVVLSGKEILYLKINGERIKNPDRPPYRAMVEDLLKDTPPSPAPPAPPLPPAPPASFKVEIEEDIVRIERSLYGRALGLDSTRRHADDLREMAIELELVEGGLLVEREALQRAEIELQRALQAEAMGEMFPREHFMARVDRPSQSISARMEHQLLKDGFIKDVNSYRFELSKKKMSVDGLKMPAAVHEKYLQLYSEAKGDPMTDKAKLSINKQSE